MIYNHGHTQRDADELRAAGIDPQDTQPREHGTFCLCGRSTWHQMGRCDAHYLPPAAVRRRP